MRGMNAMQFVTVLKIFRDVSDNDNIQNLAHNMRMTYTTIRKNIYDFERLGFLTTKKDGRQIHIKLTERGKKMAILFKQMDLIISEGDKSCSSEGIKK